MTGMTERRSTRWGRVQAWWFQRVDLDADHLAVLAALSTYADCDGFCEPSQSTLAAQVKRSRPWVNRVIGDLARLGLIEKTARHRRHNNGTTSCRYKLAFEECSDAGSVPGMTPAVAADDTPCRPDDRTQRLKELNQDTRPPHEPLSGTIMAGKADETEAIPDGWVPSHAAIAEARNLCGTIDPERHAAMFALKCRAKNYRYARGKLDQAWLSWITEDWLREEQRTAGVAGRLAHANVRVTSAERQERRFAAWARSAATPPAPPLETQWN